MTRSSTVLMSSGTWQDPGVVCLSLCGLWPYGCLAIQTRPADGARCAHPGQELSHPFSLASAMPMLPSLHQFRQEGQQAQEQAEAVMTLATEQGFTHWLAVGTILRGWALATQGHAAEGMAQMRQGLAAYRATGAELARPYYLALLAEAYRTQGRSRKGSPCWPRRWRWWTNMESAGGRQSCIGSRESCCCSRPSRTAPQAEACFQQALDVARHQQAKSLELRAAMSLSRLWQRQGKRAEARAAAGADLRLVHRGL